MLCHIQSIDYSIASEPRVDSPQFASTSSESFNGDELDDSLVTLTEVTAITNEIKNDRNRPFLNDETPCSGTVYGKRSYDCTKIWSSFMVYSFEIKLKSH